jgi:hypothetical protein
MPLLWVHAFRVVGGTIRVPGAVDARIPMAFREMIGYGDMATAFLVLLALIALRAPWGDCPGLGARHSWDARARVAGEQRSDRHAPVEAHSLIGTRLEPQPERSLPLVAAQITCFFRRE